MRIHPRTFRASLLTASIKKILLLDISNVFEDKNALSYYKTYCADNLYKKEHCIRNFPEITVTHSKARKCLLYIEIISKILCMYALRFFLMCKPILSVSRKRKLVSWNENPVTSCSRGILTNYADSQEYLGLFHHFVSLAQPFSFTYTFSRLLTSLISPV